MGSKGSVRACESCWQRKVKVRSHNAWEASATRSEGFLTNGNGQCDKITPTCSACKKSKQECHYREQSFVDQTVSARSTAQKKWRARAQKSITGPGPPEQEASIPSWLSPPREQLVLGRFILDFAGSSDLPTQESSLLVLPFFNQLKNNSPRSSLLGLAFDSAAEMNFANRHGLLDSKIAAADKYAKVLRALRSAVQYPGRARTDETLCAIYLAATYEES